MLLRVQKATREAAGAATGGADESIGNVVKADAAAKGGDKESVNGIAKGIKGIVDAAEKADAKEGKLDVKGADGTGNEDAGKLFAKKAAVSGEQILKAIVDAVGKDGEKGGVKAEKATNPIDAAIGSAGANDDAAAFKDGMKKDDQIAAAMVLRGMAKEGQFALKDDHAAHEGTVKNAVESAKAAKEAAGAATGGTDESIGNVVKADAAAKGGDAASVNGIAKGIKGIVDAAEKADAKEGKLNVEKANGEGNVDAGKLFVKKNNDGGEAGDAGKAAAAVAAVSGEQILKAIVDAVGKDGEKGGVKAEKAKNPIDAAIGSTGAGDDAAAAAFNENGMKKDDQIAAAMVLRGMAKEGQFALKNDHDNHKGTVKNAVESAKAAREAAGAATGGTDESIGNVVKAAAAAAAKGGAKESVNGIAKGIKGIVDAAEKADAKEGKLNVEKANGEGNKDAGKLFAKKNNDGGEAEDAGKAAAAVAAVSGEQILKAIVDAAKDGEKKEGKKAEKAKNPIDAAIGSTGADDDAAAFKEDEMKKDDQIAAAMVLRGMAKEGQFALKDADAAHEGTVKNAVESAKAAREAAGAATGGADESIGNVVKAADGAAAAKGGDKESVNGIAKGIKGIVDAAEKANAKEGKLDVKGADGEGNVDAGKLFAKKAADGGEAGDAGKAAAAVAAVSGEQILKAIVDAVKDGEKKGGVKAGDATNPIDAAIGSTGANDAAAAFKEDGMKKDDQIAAAMVLRGMAKEGQFALKNDHHDNHKGTVKNAVESAKGC